MATGPRVCAMSYADSKLCSGGFLGIVLNFGSGAEIEQHAHCPAVANAAEKYNSMPCQL